MDTLNSILNFEIFSIGDTTVKISKLAVIVLTIFVIKILLWIVKKTLIRKHKITTLDTGTSYAIYQIIKYVLYVAAISFILENFGIKVTLLLASSAALLVGVGLGLQQTFNDIVSGFILLTERSIKINDVLEVDDEVVKIESIGLRTSKALNRDDISIIIPNSLITTSKVINWSHQSQKTRFKIDVRIAYGSDVDLALKILEESAFEHPKVFNRELIEARLINFGYSSLDLQLLFFSKNVFRIDRTKSSIRKIINRKFAENNIKIPFPQMDVHFKSNNTEIK
ncbi:mechanosensitive ion channel [Lutibacter sp. A80]|uniref:mechanosensitive ion channel family protein n=1 Tax=Lutibacter sp. A80 TaxID=2918453 RepID=UPI001F06B599|nr:mechanosensitive ion channel domain-containing protein [Lutibacter sp. A80]UMB61572.1 mechanosensitive ion channel [Lutibacter sp. A80]